MHHRFVAATTFLGKQWFDVIFIGTKGGTKKKVTAETGILNVLLQPFDLLFGINMHNMHLLTCILRN